MAFRRSSEKDEDVYDEKKAGHMETAAPQFIEIGDYRVLGITQEDADWYMNYPEDRRKKIFRKVSRPKRPVDDLSSK